MKREAMAGRLVNYGDAIVAFPAVDSLAFLVALSETEARCSLGRRLDTARPADAARLLLRHADDQAAALIHAACPFD